VNRACRVAYPGGLGPFRGRAAPCTPCLDRSTRRADRQAAAGAGPERRERRPRTSR